MTLNGFRCPLMAQAGGTDSKHHRGVAKMPALQHAAAQQVRRMEGIRHFIHAAESLRARQAGCRPMHRRPVRRLVQDPTDRRFTTSSQHAFEISPTHSRLFLIYGNIPRLVLGCPIELPHLIPSLSSGSLLVFFMCFIPAYWILTECWLFFRSGAEGLARHPGILRGSPRDTNAIKRELFSFSQGPSFLFFRLL